MLALLEMKKPLPFVFGFILLLVASKLLWHVFGPRLLINFTDSVPLGIYRLERTSELRRGMYVALKPPKKAVEIAFGRPWFRPENMFIKEVAGVAADEICAVNQQLLINQQNRGPISTADKQGLLLPYAEGCYKLETDEVFLLGPNSPWSFDSRYWGVVSRDKLQFRAVIVW